MFDELDYALEFAEEQILEQELAIGGVAALFEPELMIELEATAVA